MQSWFMERLGVYLAEHGRSMVGWDEILQGGVPPSATVMSWRGTQGAITAARLGHDVVLAPVRRPCISIIFKAVGMMNLPDA